MMPDALRPLPDADRRRERAFELDTVLATLAGPVCLRPLDVLMAAYRCARSDAAVETALRAVVRTQRRVVRMLDRQLGQASLPHARWLLRLLHAQRDALRALRRPIPEAAPALERWRRQVLEARPPRSALERAAAWELTALECERAGNPDHAHRARLAAAQCLATASPHKSSHAA